MKKEMRCDNMDVQDTLLEVPFYPYSAAYASEHGEMEQYHSSYQASLACRGYIEQAINAHYRNNRLDTVAAARDVLKKFGMERVKFVLAATIRYKIADGRISHDNKAWVNTVPMPEDRDSSRDCYLVVDQVNPGLVDLFTSRVRLFMRNEEDNAGNYGCTE